MNKEEIVNIALEKFNERLSTHIDNNNIVTEAPENTINILGNDFLCVVDELATPTRLEEIEIRYNYLPVIYFFPNVLPKMQKYMEIKNLNYIDCAGNFNIVFKENGNLKFFLRNLGEPPFIIKEDATYPLFKEAGLKTIFFLLQNKKNIALPFRKIKEETGVALGTINKILYALEFHRFMNINSKQRILTNLTQLLETWAYNFIIEMKPKLLIGKMKFRDNKTLHNWKAIQLPDDTFWGGEAAEALTTAYLDPGKFEIYTEKPLGYLVKTGNMLPDPNGEISIYQKFWPQSQKNNVVPFPLIYADLLNNPSSRCVEAAQLLKKQWNLFI